MTDKPVSEDTLALKQVAAGGKAGQKALEQLFRKFRRPLLGFLRKKGLTSAEADDVVQQVFLVVASKAHTFRGESEVSSWLYGIARHEMVNAFRATRLEDNLDEEGWEAVNNTKADELVCPMQPDARKAFQECFYQAYKAFAKAHPAAADLIYRTLQNENWDTRDIAQYLDRTTGAAREYLSQCRKKLKPFVEPCRHLLGTLP